MYVDTLFFFFLNHLDYAFYSLKSTLHFKGAESKVQRLLVVLSAPNTCLVWGGMAWDSPQFRVFKQLEKTRIKYHSQMLIVTCVIRPIKIILLLDCAIKREGWWRNTLLQSSIFT